MKSPHLYGKSHAIWCISDWKHSQCVKTHSPANDLLIYLLRQLLEHFVLFCLLHCINLLSTNVNKYSEQDSEEINDDDDDDDDDTPSISNCH